MWLSSHGLSFAIIRLPNTGYHRYLTIGDPLPPPLQLPVTVTVTATITINPIPTAFIQPSDRPIQSQVFLQIPAHGQFCASGQLAPDHQVVHEGVAMVYPVVLVREIEQAHCDIPAVATP